MSNRNGSSNAPPAPQETAKQRPCPRSPTRSHQGHDLGQPEYNGTWYNVTLSRSYRDGEEWKSSSSFGRDELLTVAKVADMANSWIHGQSQVPANTGHDSEQPEEEIPY